MEFKEAKKPLSKKEYLKVLGHGSLIALGGFLAIHPESFKHQLLAGGRTAGID
ncbi:hypothetical protein [Legionella clemsonensis]|uniref:Uncharacterized protein n=1 Tax=Legionella clemsonensis TaxID=1867846 RepID=A0A222P624_9GAMM|nr:hypothetical protein [Legionella clemsonensis]ASQ47310.1 hypothetical protein clem_13920 [Legionella clemsonensis]